MADKKKDKPLPGCGPSKTPPYAGQIHESVHEMLKDMPAETLMKKLMGGTMLPRSVLDPLRCKAGELTFKMKLDDRMSESLRELGKRYLEEAKAIGRDRGRGKPRAGVDDDPDPDRILGLEHGGVEEVPGPWPGCRAWEWPSGGADGWGEGPWEVEPDKVQWLDTFTGLHCIILRSVEAGSLNGYVGLYHGHPLHGKHMDWRRPLVMGISPVSEALTSDPECRSSCLGQDIDIHGGLSFAGPSVIPVTQDEEGRSLCLADDITGGDQWWFGFHCGGYRDGTPVILQGDGPAARGLVDWPYRDMGFVGRECSRLARQLKQIHTEAGPESPRDERTEG